MTIEEFRKNIEVALKDYKQKHAIYFSWICGVRVLPFLGIGKNFNYWRKKSINDKNEQEKQKQKHLESIFTALDIAYVASAVYYVENYNHCIPVNIRNDVFSAINDVTNSDEYKAVKCAIATIIKITNVLHAEGYEYDYINFHTTFGQGPYLLVISNAIEVAVAAAKTFYLHGLLDDFYKIIVNDIEVIKNNKLTFFNKDINIYGNLWDKFINGLNNNNCEYWAKMFSNLFSKYFIYNEEDLQKRINLFEARYEGAAGIGKFMQNRTTLLQMSMHEKTKVFLSYCSKESDLADKIDDLFSGISYISISRDTRDVGYRDSFKKYMKKVNVHNFIIMLISDNFLKSQSCMFEVSELFKDSNFEKKLLFIIVSDDDCKYLKKSQSLYIGAKLYSSVESNEYIIYWEKQYKILKESLSKIDSEEAKIESSKKLREIKRIIDHDLSPFIEYLRDSRGKSFSELYETKFNDFISIIDSFRKKNYPKLKKMYETEIDKD
ncbi:MAG: toll/interleukin-1 receptor domain-containing protein [Treponema sp.]|nr:toll/interleukin-1 receptor domain-containing protein [Treponema sp.]